MNMTLQKRLDKYPKTVYNLRKGSEGVPYIGDYYKEHVIKNHPYEANPLAEDGVAGLTRNQLSVYAEKVKEVYTKEGFDKIFPTEPIFAGGVLRDLMQGAYPRDVDLFINTYGMTDEEAEDNIALFCHKLGWDVKEHDLTGSAYGKTVDGEFKKSTFVIFDVGMGTEPILLQVIGRDCGVIDSPLDITKDFDYNMVMVAMTMDGDIHLSPQFQLGYEEGVTVVYRASGEARSKERLLRRYRKEVLLRFKPSDAKSIMDAKLKEREKHLAKVIKQTNYDFRAPMPYLRQL